MFLAINHQRMIEILNKIARLASSLFSIGVALIIFISAASIGLIGMTVVLLLVAAGLLIYGLTTYLQSMTILLTGKKWNSLLPRLGLLIAGIGALLFWVI